VDLPGYHPSVKPHEMQIKKAAKALMEADRPVIYAGGGVKYSGAHRELFELAVKVNAPVTTTLMGIGCFPEDHPLSLGMLGMARHQVCELCHTGGRSDCGHWSAL